MTTAALFALANTLPIVAEALLACYMQKQRKLPITQKDLVVACNFWSLKLINQPSLRLSEELARFSGFEIVAQGKGLNVFVVWILD